MTATEIAALSNHDLFHRFNEWLSCPINAMSKDYISEGDPLEEELTRRLTACGFLTGEEETK